MEFNAEEGFVKYSKSNAKMDLFGVDLNLKIKGKQIKFGLKTLAGLLLATLMIVTGLIVGLTITSMDIQKLKHENQHLQQDLKTQKQIAKELKAKNEILSTNLENMTNALAVREFEIGNSKEQIQNLIVQNQNLIDDFESKHQSLEHYQNLHQNCSEEQQLSMALIEDLKSQNQNLTKDLEQIDLAKHIIPEGIKKQILFRASQT